MKTKTIARNTGGKYFRASSNSKLETIYKEINKPILREEVIEKPYDVTITLEKEVAMIKEVLVEKARLISNHIPTKGNDWKINFEELNKLMEEWKTITAKFHQIKG